MFKRQSPLVRKLKKNPNHIYVEDKFMAVLMPDGQNVLVIPGSFKDLTPEEANLKLQDILLKMQ